MFLIYSLLIFVIKKYVSKTVASRYFNIREEYYLRVYFGTPQKEAMHLINLNLQNSWTISFFYSQGSSTTSVVKGEVELQIKDNLTESAIEIQDSLAIETLNSKNTELITINDFSFYWVDYSSLTNSMNDGLAFAHSLRNSFSITHQLFDNGHINKKAFTLLPFNHSEKTEGEFLFGEFPEGKKRYFPYSSFCNAIQGISWSCKLNSIRFNSNRDYIVPERTKLYFHLKEMTYFPKETFEFIHENFYPDCSEYNNFEVTLLKCGHKEAKGIKLLNFIVDESVFEIRQEDLFECSSEDCFSQFTFGSGVYENYVLGVGFLKNYAVTFDYDEDKIFFYSEEQRFGKIEEINRRQVLVLLTFVMVSCLLGSIINLMLFKSKLYH